MYIYEARYQPPEGDMEVTRFISEDIPRDLATTIRKCGNEVQHTERDGNNYLMPWINQVITANGSWTIIQLGDVNADQNGCIRYICDQRDKVADPGLTDFDVDISRSVSEVFSVRVAAADIDSAKAKALKIAESDDMQSEWDIHAKGNAYVYEVQS